MTPSRDQLREALSAAAGAHHEYEQVALGGQHDAQWSGFYAAYVLGRLALLVSCSRCLRRPATDIDYPWAIAQRRPPGALAELFTWSGPEQDGTLPH